MLMWLDVGLNISSGESTEHRIESTSTYIDESLAIGTNAAVYQPVDIDSQAAGNAGSSLASANTSDLVAAGTGFSRPVPQACLTCPACNGKHRSHTCNVPQNERPVKQGRVVVQKNSDVSHAELLRFAKESAHQDMNPRAGRQRKRKVVWEPKPEEKRVVHSRPQPQQLATGRSGGSSNIANTAWQQPDAFEQMFQNERTGGGAVGPRSANSATTGLSRIGSRGSGEKPAKKRNNKKKVPPAYGPVQDICLEEHIGQRVATYWDIDRVRFIVLCAASSTTVRLGSGVGCSALHLQMSFSPCAVSAGVVQRQDSGV